MQPLINPGMTSSASSLNLHTNAAGTTPSYAAVAGAPEPFSDLLSDAVGQVNQLEAQARGACVGGEKQSGAGLSAGNWNAVLVPPSFPHRLSLAAGG